MYLLLRDRETECEQGRGREKETEHEAGSRLRAVSTEPDVGLELTNHEIMTWAEVRHLTNWAHEGTPRNPFKFKKKKKKKQWNN